MGAHKTTVRPSAAMARKEYAAEFLQSLVWELQGVIPLQTPAWVGCVVGSRITVMRDVASGQCMVLAGVDADRAMSFLDAGVESLFCAPSDWLDAWIDARGRDHSDRLAKDAAEAWSWSSSDARAMTARLTQMPVATEASRRIGESLLLSAEDVDLARRLRRQTAGRGGSATFGHVQLVLQRGPLLRRVASEHPAWLTLAAQQLRFGSISPYRDVMQQLKSLARVEGMSHAAWAQLVADGPQFPATPFAASLERDVVTELGMEDEAVEWEFVVAAGKARHWLGDYWAGLHPSFRDRIVRFTAQHSPRCDWVECLLQALGEELEAHVEAFESAADIENEFVQIAATLQTYEDVSTELALDEEEHFQIVTAPGIPEPPRQRGWHRWQRWHSAMERYLARPFWVPIPHLEQGAFCADALASRFDLSEESETMRHCIAKYTGRCESGTYVAYRIQTHGGHALATIGINLSCRTDDAGAVATHATLDEVSGPGNEEVSEALRQFAGWVVTQINQKLPMPIVQPGADSDEADA